MVFEKGYIPWNKGKICPNLSEARKKGLTEGTIMPPIPKGHKFPHRSERYKGEGNPFYGKKHRKETLARMVQASIGNSYNLGKHQSKEVKKKIREAMRNNPHAGYRGTARHQRLVNQMARQLSKNGDKVEVEKVIKINSTHWRIIDILVNDNVCFEIGQCPKSKIEELNVNGFKVVHLPYSILEVEV